jgi:hypothetical protein
VLTDLSTTVGHWRGSVDKFWQNNREDNTIIDLKPVEKNEFIWLGIGTRGRAVVNTVMNLRVP